MALADGTGHQLQQVPHRGCCTSPKQVQLPLRHVRCRTGVFTACHHARWGCHADMPAELLARTAALRLVASANTDPPPSLGPGLILRAADALDKHVCAPVHKPAQGSSEPPRAWQQHSVAACNVDRTDIPNLSCSNQSTWTAGESQVAGTFRSLVSLRGCVSWSNSKGQQDAITANGP